MTIKWLQLVGGSLFGPNGHAFSTAVETRAGSALTLLEAETIAEYDGALWLAQGGYERVALSIEYRADKKGRARRAVPTIGPLISPDYSVVWPEMGAANVDEMVAHLRPVVLEALEFVGERKGLGPLPRAGQAGKLRAIAKRPFVDDPEPYAEEPGDSFVITRDLPADLDPSEAPEVLRRYEEELASIVQDSALKNVIETETSTTAVRWVVQIANLGD